MSGENWESLLTEKGFMRVPRALRLKRAELGITNNEYTILLDYIDYYSFSGTMNPYRHLSEVSGMNERSIRRALTSLEKKGFLKRKVSSHGNGRTNGVIFSIDPLVRKLKSIMKKMSPTVGEENVPYVGEEFVTPNTREEFNKRDEDKNTSAKNADGCACADESVSVREDRRDERQISHAVRSDNEGEACDCISGWSGETAGPQENAGRNDRHPVRQGDAVTNGGEASQIHLAPELGRLDGPRNPFFGEDGLNEREISQGVHPERSRRTQNDKGEVPPHPFHMLDKSESMDTITPLAKGLGRPASRIPRSSFPRGGEGMKKKDEAEFAAGAAYSDIVRKGEKKPGGPSTKLRTGAYSSTRWYNEVFRDLYERAASQPALTGGREYKSAETYFRRLRELNPEMEPEEIYALAGEGAAFMLCSQLEGGIFGWVSRPPDICILSSQAQSVDWHLRRMRAALRQSDPSRLRLGPSPRRAASSGGNPHSDPGSESGTGPPPGKGREIIVSGEGSDMSTAAACFCPSTGSGRTDEISSADASGVVPEGPDMSTDTVSFDPSAGSERLIEASGVDSDGGGRGESFMGADSARFIEKITEKIEEEHYANEQIERVYGELRGIESASCGRTLPARKRALRRSGG